MFFAFTLAYMQDDHAKQQLLSQVLTQQEQIKCFMRDRKRSLGAALQQASLWAPKQQSSVQPQHSPSYEQQEQQPLSSASQQHLHMHGASAHVPEGSGYVDVCGIVLPSKTSAGHGQLAAPSLVQTAAMADDLRAAALALSQSRPILLEGPPGMTQTGSQTYLSFMTSSPCSVHDSCTANLETFSQ